MGGDILLICAMPSKPNPPGLLVAPKDKVLPPETAEEGKTYSRLFDGSRCTGMVQLDTIFVWKRMASPSLLDYSI